MDLKQGLKVIRPVLLISWERRHYGTEKSRMMKDSFLRYRGFQGNQTIYRPFLAGVILASSAGAAIVTWDNEATTNGNPNTSWFAADNWNSNMVPGSGDDVRLLTHGGADPVRLSTNSAEVNSVVSRVPFDLGSTLTVSALSTFENSLVGTSIGTLRANGLIVLQGNNNGTRTTFEGTTGYRNEGRLSLASRSVSAFFDNRTGATVTLEAAGIGLSNFLNQGTLDLGSRGELTAISSVVNLGSVVKSDPGNTSEIAGDFIQTAGTIRVDPGAELWLTGRVQRLEGGSLEINGNLRLSSSVGGEPERIFDGLSSVNGQGSVDQVRSYEVASSLSLNLPNSPGYRLGDLSLASGVTVTNEGVVSIEGVEVVSSSEPNPLSASFMNHGTIESDGNPLFSVYTENQSNWTTTSMRLGTEFENGGTMILKGAFTRMGSVNGGFLSNAGRLSFEPAGAGDTYYLDAEVRNRPEGSLRTNYGRLIVNSASQAFSGRVEAADPGSEIRLLGQEYLVSADTLTFAGNGEIWLGTSGIEAALSHDGNNIVNLAGDPKTETPDDEGLWLRNAELFAPNSGAVANRGLLRWGDANIIGSTGELFSLENSGLMILEPSGLKYLEAGMAQQGELRQFGALSVESSSHISNSGKWRMLGSSNISNFSAAADPADFENKGELIHDHSGTSVVGIDLKNPGFVTVRSGTLVLNRPADLDANGVLRGEGNWLVEGGGSIQFPVTLTELSDGVRWDGGSSGQVSRVTGGATFSPASGQTNPPLVVDGGTLEISGTFTTPQLTLNDATITGIGTIEGEIIGLENTTLQVGGVNTTQPLNYHSTTRQILDLGDGTSSGTAPLSSTSSVNVGGTVVPRLELTQGFTPGQTYPLVNGSTVTGTLDFVDHSQISGRVKFTPTYSGTEVGLTTSYIQYPDYASWALDNFSSADLTDPTISGTDADPDRDGLSNAQEYAFATGPRTYTANPVTLESISGDQVTINFPLAKGMTDHAYTILGGSDLTGLSEVPLVETNTAGEGPVSNIECRIQLSPAEFQGGRFFFSVQTNINEL